MLQMLSLKWKSNSTMRCMCYCNSHCSVCVTCKSHCVMRCAYKTPNKLSHVSKDQTFDTLLYSAEIRQF